MLSVIEHPPLHTFIAYNPIIAKRICDLVSTHQCGLKQLCKRFPELPPETCINEWRFKYHDFGAQYARAKQAQLSLLAESLIEYSQVEHYYDEKGAKRVDSGMVARQRLVTDNIKWLASKLIPKVYGDRVTQDVNITVTHEDSLGLLE